MKIANYSPLVIDTTLIIKHNKIIIIILL